MFDSPQRGNFIISSAPGRAHIYIYICIYIYIFQYCTTSFNQNVCFGNANILDDMLVHPFFPRTQCLCHPHHLLLVSLPFSDSSFQANPTRIALGNPKPCKLFSYLMILVKPSYFSRFHISQRIHHHFKTSSTHFFWFCWWGIDIQLPKTRTTWPQRMPMDSKPQVWGMFSSKNTLETEENRRSPPGMWQKPGK